MSEIDRYIEELRDTVRVAWLNYEIWWVYKSTDTRPEYLDTMNRYTLFFQTSIHAHFVALLVALYRLFETRDDTYNIPTLLKLLRDQGSFPDAKLRELDTLYAKAKPLWVKVNILRNKAFGHRSKAHKVSEVFAEAGVTPNELRDLAEVTKKLLNTATLAWANNAHAFNLSSRADTLSLLQDLKACHEG
jgi:hypothetical protein